MDLLVDSCLKRLKRVSGVKVDDLLCMFGPDYDIEGVITNELVELSQKRLHYLQHRDICCNSDEENVEEDISDMIKVVQLGRELRDLSYRKAGSLHPLRIPDNDKYISGLEPSFFSHLRQDDSDDTADSRDNRRKRAVLLESIRALFLSSHLEHISGQIFHECLADAWVPVSVPGMGTEQKFMLHPPRLQNALDHFKKVFGFEGRWFTSYQLEKVWDELTPEKWSDSHYDELTMVRSQDIGRIIKELIRLGRKPGRGEVLCEGDVMAVVAQEMRNLVEPEGMLLAFDVFWGRIMEYETRHGPSGCFYQDAVLSALRLIFGRGLYDQEYLTRVIQRVNLLQPEHGEKLEDYRPLSQSEDPIRPSLDRHREQCWRADTRLRLLPWVIGAMGGDDAVDGRSGDSGKDEEDKRDTNPYDLIWCLPDLLVKKGVAIARKQERIASGRAAAEAREEQGRARFPFLFSMWDDGTESEVETMDTTTNAQQERPSDGEELLPVATPMTTPSRPSPSGPPPQERPPMVFVNDRDAMSGRTFLLPPMGMQGLIGSEEPVAVHPEVIAQMMEARRGDEIRPVVSSWLQNLRKSRRTGIVRLFYPCE